ncbi:MAG: hypothetical protein ACRD2G_05190 [Terriglobia bacterium]
MPSQSAPEGQAVSDCLGKFGIDAIATSVPGLAATSGFAPSFGCGAASAADVIISIIATSGSPDALMFLLAFIIAHSSSFVIAFDADEDCKPGATLSATRKDAAETLRLRQSVGQLGGLKGGFAGNDVGANAALTRPRLTAKRPLDMQMRLA